MSVPAETINPEFSQPYGIEMDADKALAIAEQAHLALESLNGGREYAVIGDSITFDTRSLEEMGENGPIALIRVGTSLVKLYQFNVSAGDKIEKRYGVTHADFYDEAVEDRQANVGLRFIDTSLSLGRTTDGAGQLGLSSDERVAAVHFDLEADSVQIRITDQSQFHEDAHTKLGTYVIAKERNYTSGNVVDILHAKQLGRRILSRDIQ